MNFIFDFLKNTKIGKFIDNKINGDKKHKEKHPKKEHHHFSDNDDDDNWCY